MKKYFPVELHCHTIHSDGSMTPEALVENAQKRGYSAIALTDHNTASGFIDAVKSGEKNRVVVIKGIEWTTFFGHIVCLHDDDFVVDWRSLTMENIDEKAEEAKIRGAILTLAHPKRIGSPVGTGCHMDFPIKRFDCFSAVEVWSQNELPDSDANKLSERMYDELLGKGFRLAAVYGYDWHTPLMDREYFINTYIGAEECTPEALKDGIRRGDTYLAFGLKAELYADGAPLAFGAEISRGKHSFYMKIQKGLCNGATAPKSVVLKGTALNEELRFDVGAHILVELKKGWLRFAAEGDAGERKNLPLIFTSPIFVL
ncbi:MAG: CehA/McbA family metallohydrolase [Clostridiales bacterium]|jgi:hypothetical protein|nr:CehA/McbA family metallohydrolase [Clostridiales bacterium]